MNELNIKVNIPEGYEIDKEKSTFKNIVLKPIKEYYKTVYKKLFSNKDIYFILSTGDIEHIKKENKNIPLNGNGCTSKKQAEKLLAINQLMNVAKYLNGDWSPDWENIDPKYAITIEYNKIGIIDCWSCNCRLIYFKTEELAQKAIEILGEDTIRLALSTDW